MAETERFEKQSFDFLHLFLCYSVLFSSLSHFLSTYAHIVSVVFIVIAVTLLSARAVSRSGF